MERVKFFCPIRAYLGKAAERFLATVTTFSLTFWISEFIGYSGGLQRTLFKSVKLAYEFSARTCFQGYHRRSDKHIAMQRDFSCTILVKQLHRQPRSLIDAELKISITPIFTHSTARCRRWRQMSCSTNQYEHPGLQILTTYWT